MNTGFKAVKFDVKSFKFFTKPKTFARKTYFTPGKWNILRSEVSPRVCYTGYHYCEELCSLKFYSKPKLDVFYFKIESKGLENCDFIKTATKNIRLLEEINYDEVLKKLGDYHFDRKCKLKLEYKDSNFYLKNKLVNVVFNNSKLYKNFLLNNPNRKYFTVKVFFTNGYNNHKPKSKTILVVTS